MAWEKLKEMNLYDKLEDHLKTVPTKDTEKVEEIITSTEGLQKINKCIHEGMDPRTTGEAMNLSVDQVNIIKDILGKL
ncbi:hypothetical protein KQI89_10410 [Clostridium sp. MSJ-4]|uniref:Uncharacterized protein n=1 Tax=Clostridium simiarum TaxID=2841506 RepID=A0ABS6F1P9_9CLOT|nr:MULTISPECIES: hypothetical protein [Clostridium]MBU5592173.1 hypothetical protein [Clostridium simiarum]